MDCLRSSIPILKVLCDETRLGILCMLSERDMNGCEIHSAFDCTQPTISYHMRLLVDAGLVHARKDGCAVVYSVNRDIWPHVSALVKALCTAGQKGGANE